MKQSILLGAILAMLASMSWGAMFPVAHDAFNYINPFYFTLLRYIPVVCILIVMLYMMEGKKAFKLEGKGLSLWVYGTMGFTVYNLFIFWGQDMLGDTGVLVASIMEALAPIISVLIIWLLYQKKPYRFTIFTIIGAFIGVVLVVTNGNLQILFASGRVIPLLILFLAAAGWAAYTIGGGAFPEWSVLRYSTLSALLGTFTATIVVVVISIFGWINVPTMSDIYMVRFHMLFMIFIPGLAALLFWNKGVSMLSPINAILFINLAPVTTVIIRFLQGYTISTFELAGVFIVCCMIVANNIFQRYMQAKKAKYSIKEKLSA